MTKRSSFKMVLSGYELHRSGEGRQPMRPSALCDLRKGDLAQFKSLETGKWYKGFGGMTIFYCESRVLNDGDADYIICS